MRRQRTMLDWTVYILAALAVMLAVAMVLYAIESAARQREIDSLNLRIKSEAEETSESGGAEVPVPEIAPGPEWRFPVAESDYRALTSPYGYRVSPLLGIEMHHQGLDIAAVWRAQVVAVADGVVAEHWPPPGTPYPGGGTYRGHDVYGGMIRIEHDGGLASVYAHLSATRVHTGDRVRSGQVIGRIGDTGKSDGEHLHFAIEGPDGALNPLLYVEDPRR